MRKDNEVETDEEKEERGLKILMLQADRTKTVSMKTIMKKLSVILSDDPQPTIEPIEDDMIFDTLVVLVRLKSGKIYQAALTEEMSNALYSYLRSLYFPDGIVKIMPTELQGIEFSENPNYKPKIDTCTKTYSQ